METSKTNTLVIEAKTADGRQNASINIPLGFLHFGIKILNLLPASLKGRLDRELAAKGVHVSFDALVSEGHDVLVETLRNIKIDVQDEKQQLKMFVNG